MAWWLGMVGAPNDPHENMLWQYRHPARFAFALALVMSGFFSAWLLAATGNVGLATTFFVVTLSATYVLFYVAARIRIAVTPVRRPSRRRHRVT